MRKYALNKIEIAMVSHNGNIRHCARSALRPVGIPPSRGRHSALTRQFLVVGIPPVGIRARTPSNHPSKTWGSSIYPLHPVATLVVQSNSCSVLLVDVGCRATDRTDIARR